MDSIELSGNSNSHEGEALEEHHAGTIHRQQSALPPADRGPQAWLCLLGCFMTNVVIWGFAFSFGVFQDYYSTHEPFSQRPDGIPAIGTTATGVMYLLMPVYFAVYQRWPRLRNYSIGISLPVMAAALIGASFAVTVSQLILCQGVLYALAGNALVVPTITYLDEWFIRKKGLAVGIMWAGDGTGGVIMPLILQPLLERCGFRWTLRAYAGILIVLTAPLLFFLKPRLPTSGTRAIRPIDTAFLRTPLFWVLQLFNVAQALGYFLPINYLPSYAQSLGISSTFSSVLLLIANLASIFGCVAMGALNDRMDVTKILFGVALSSGLSVFLILGFSTSLAPLCIFSFLYGLTAGSYSTSWGGMVKDIQHKYEGTDATIVFGLLGAGRGVGSIISGPLSKSLLASGPSLQRAASSAYGSTFGPIIIFSGCTAVVSGGSWVARRFGVI